MVFRIICKMDELISTAQSSLQAIYGLFIGSLAVFSDLRKGSQIITLWPSSSSSSSSSTPESTVNPVSQEKFKTKISESSVTFNTEANDFDHRHQLSTNLLNNDKGRIIRLISDGLACWHFFANLFYLIKQTFFVKFNIVQPDKVALNSRRVQKLSTKLHETMFKSS